MADVLRIAVRRKADERAAVQFVDFRDGTRAGIKARYSALADRWWLWIVALDGTTIATLGPAVGGVDLLLGHKHDPRVPQGQLFVWSVERVPMTLETVDASAVLLYRRAGDVTG